MHASPQSHNSATIRKTPPALRSSRRQVRSEARSLFAMIERGQAADSIRDLISVSPRSEAKLRQFAQANPEEAIGILRILEFRRTVGMEFERLVRRAERRAIRRPANVAGSSDVAPIPS